jgi:drug/metabolite transporter (DMT)-like permease
MKPLSLSQRFPHLTAVLQALFVTFLWSTSWVLIKIGLADIPALTFAGLRYMLAFCCLLPFAWRQRPLLPSLTRADWLRLIGLGILLYTVTQGAQFVGLAYLPSVTVSLLLNFTTVVVALLGILFLAERPSWQQWAGIGLFLGGVLLYFYPVFIPTAQIIGFVVVLVGVLGNALSGIVGRHVNRSGQLPPLLVTAVSMGIGAALLLFTGITVQGLPRLAWNNWLIIIWLAVVNTAFAFTLWNHTLRRLTAVESSLINNTMLIQIAILAWLFLDEPLTAQEIVGMVLAAAGVLVVQLKRR